MYTIKKIKDADNYFFQFWKSCGILDKKCYNIHWNPKQDINAFRYVFFLNIFVYF